MNINEHFLEAPTYEESVEQLDEEIENYSVNSQTIFLEGGSFIHNGTMFLNGNFAFCPVADVSSQAFVQPNRLPNQPPDSIYNGFVATVYSEAMSGRVLLSAPNVRYASGALLYYWYVSGQKSYEEIVSITQSYIKQMNQTPGIHSTFDTGYYNNTDFPTRSPQDDASAKMAIASVIINRANGDYIKNYHAAIKKGDPNADIKAAYDDAYDNHSKPIHYEFNGYNSQNYNYAINAMKTMKHSDDTSNITDSEVKNLYNMLWNIFYKRQVTTDANLYFSPIAQIETVGNFPSWVLTMNDFKHISSFIENKQQLEKLQASWRNIWCGKNIEMISDDFAFLSIPE